MQKADECVKEIGKNRIDFGSDAEAIRRLEMASKSTYLASRPSFMDIEPTTCCNLRCKMCSHGDAAMGIGRSEYRGHLLAHPRGRIPGRRPGPCLGPCHERIGLHILDG
jgi:hypothetical protein